MMLAASLPFPSYVDRRTTEESRPFVYAPDFYEDRFPKRRKVEDSPLSLKRKFNSHEDLFEHRQVKMTKSLPQLALIPYENPLKDNSLEKNNLFELSNLQTRLFLPQPHYFPFYKVPSSAEEYPLALVPYCPTRL